MSRPKASTRSTIPAMLSNTYAIGVDSADVRGTLRIRGTVTWRTCLPGPATPLQHHQFLPRSVRRPPSRTGGTTEPGNIFGVVFNDSKRQRRRATRAKTASSGFRVFIDANENGIFDDGDTECDYVEPRFLLL